MLNGAEWYPMGENRVPTPERLAVRACTRAGQRRCAPAPNCGSRRWGSELGPHICVDGPLEVLSLS